MELSEWILEIGYKVFVLLMFWLVVLPPTIISKKYKYPLPFRLFRIILLIGTIITIIDTPKMTSGMDGVWWFVCMVLIVLPLFVISLSIWFVVFIQRKRRNN